MKTLRTYEHDGGLFSFSVPAHWSHEIDDDGTQVFWDDDAGSGTLRVTSLTAQRESEPESLPQLGFLSEEAAPFVREDGVAWVTHRHEEEDGEPIVIFWWEFAHFIPPCYGRAAFFSFTIYANEEHGTHGRSQLKALNQIAASVRFGGIQPFEK